MDLPVFKTKIEGLDEEFNLVDPAQRQKYFQVKAGLEIEKLNVYLQDNTFVAYLLAKKNAGKGTYTRLFMEIFGEDKVAHVSIGDLVRSISKEVETPEGKKGLLEFLKKNYRGYLSAEEVLDALINRETKTLLPTEFVLALVKREIEKMPKKALFIDGFPRDLDQVSYSLFFRDLINYRNDPDFFILIDIPESIIAERIKSRVICPVCQNSRNLKTNPTLNAEFDEKTNQFYLCCDNPSCNKTRMISKEGDELGLEAIRTRLDLDAKLLNQALSLYGIGKVLLRNSVPLDLKGQYVDDYEITPEYFYELNPVNKKVEIKEKPWAVMDDDGVSSCSLLAPAVVVSMIKQMVEVLEI